MKSVVSKIVVFIIRGLKFFTASPAEAVLLPFIRGVWKKSGLEFYGYKAAAENGNSEAQFILGCMYDKGDGVKQDDAEAIKWLHKSAEQGYASAQFVLGLKYGNGDNGLKESSSEAFKWFYKAAEQGDDEAQYCVGLSYSAGLGVKANPSEAVNWLRKAARQNHSGAQKALRERNETW